jgi:predicted kinase
MKIETKLTQRYGSGHHTTLVATTHHMDDLRKLKIATKKGAKTVTVELDVHWGNFLKFCELVWRMNRNVEIG